jgi:nucleoside-diphosphate-sugar epimerase
MGERVFGPAILGKTAQVVGKVDVPHTVTFITDMGRAMALVGQHDRAFGETWHAPNSRPYTAREILGMIYREAGHPLGFRSAGRALLNTLGLFKPALREVVEMMYQFEQPFIVAHASRKHLGSTQHPCPRLCARRWLGIGCSMRLT